MPFSQVTLAQLRAQLQAKWESVPFWVDAEANFAINEALQWYNLYTGLWKSRVNMVTVADQTFYTIEGTLVYNARMEFNGRSLAQASLGDMDNGRPNWQGETTTSESTPTRPEVWLPVGMDTFAIWPADAAGQNSILVDGVMDTPILTTDNQFINIDQTEIDTILGEALHISAFKDPGRFPRTAPWHKAFLENVMAHNGRLKAANAFRFTQGVDREYQNRPLSVEAK